MTSPSNNPFTSPASSTYSFPSSNSPSAPPPVFHAGPTSTPSPSRRPYGSPVQVLHRAVQPPSAQQTQAELAEHQQHLQRARLAFSQWDRNRDGAISTGDVAAVLGEAQLPYTEESLKAMIAGLDVNKTGRVEWDEFERAMLHKLKRERYDPPSDIETEMTQELRHKQQVHRDMT